MSSRLKWEESNKRKRPKSNLADEKERRDKDPAARWLKQFELDEGVTKRQRRPNKLQPRQIHD